MARKVGYDYDFVTAPPKSLECPVCLLTFRDPHVISCCGNEFCQLCIERVQRDGKPCPLCNEPNFTTFLHKKLVREVNGLVVRCPQKELGCEWEGELGQVEQHLNPGAGPSSSSGCGYVMVECRFQCGAHLQRRMVGEHEMESCPKRAIEIQVASLMRKFEVITVENKMLKQELSEMKEAQEHVNQKQQEEMAKVKHKLTEVMDENNCLQRAHKSMQKAYSELQKKHVAMKSKIDTDAVRQKTKFDFLEKTCLSLQTHTTPLPVPPFYFTVVNIEHYMKNNMVYGIESFYSHPGGYKMFVNISPKTFNPHKGTCMYLFLGVGIQRGEFDDQLQWPFSGEVTVQLYNRTEEEWSKEATIVLNKKECDMDIVQKSVDILTHGSWGYDEFLSLSELRKRLCFKEWWCY